MPPGLTMFCGSRVMTSARDACEASVLPRDAFWVHQLIMH